MIQVMVSNGGTSPTPDKELGQRDDEPIEIIDLAREGVVHLEFSGDTVARRTMTTGGMKRLEAAVDLPDLMDSSASVPVRSFEEAESAGIIREMSEEEKVLERNTLVKQLLIEMKFDEFNELRRQHEEWVPDLSDLDLTGYDLRKAKLDDAVLERAVLEYANLSGMLLDETRFNDAIMTGANLERAGLRGAFMVGTVLNGFANLKWTDLTGAKLMRADLTEAELENAALDGANIYAAILCEADLSNAHGLTPNQLSTACFSGVKGKDREFYLAAVERVLAGRKKTDSERQEAAGAQKEQSSSAAPQMKAKRLPPILGAGEKEAALGVAELIPVSPDESRLNTQAKELLVTGDAAEFNKVRRNNSSWLPDLSGINLMGQDLKEFELRDVSFKGAILIQADLTGVNLNGAHLDNAILSGAKLERANLRYASLVSTVLVSANLKKANLESAILRRADLTQAEVQGANFSGADIYGAALRDANLSGAQNLSPQQLCTACFNGARVDRKLYGTATGLLEPQGPM